MEIPLKPDLKPGELRCPRCFGKDVVPSQNRGLVDSLMVQLGRIPRHCRSCGKRFYVAATALLVAQGAAQAGGSAGPKIR